MMATMLEMGNSVETVSHNMETLLSGVEGTFQSVTTVTDFSTNIAANTNELAQQTQKTIALINESITTLDQVTGRTEISKQLSQETIHDALEGQQAVEHVRSSMDTIQETNRKTVETMTRFERLPKEIGTILDVIQDITEQSSLLALNASIIAAQAGSHGKGFSVIAEEMRNLASGVNTSTKDIATIMNTIQQETNSVVQMVREVTADIEQGVQRTLGAQETLQKIIGSVQRSSGVVNEIADALGIQSTANRTIMGDIDRVRSMMEKITNATNEQKTSTLHINEAVRHILEMASQTQEVATQQLKDMQQVLSTIGTTISNLTEQNLESSRHINQTTTADLAEQSKILLKAIDRFQVKII
jgi:methyl-accepting chemotaxis protein